MSRRAFHGVIPAMAVLFRDDYKIDEEGDAHARMKEGLALRGLFRSALARPPVLPPSPEEVAAMRAALEASGVSRVDLV